MAASVPVPWFPISAQAGMRRHGWLYLATGPYAGAGNLRRARFRVGTSGAMTTLLWDSLWRAFDGAHVARSGSAPGYAIVWALCPVALLSVAPLTTYYWDAAHENDLGEVSSYSAAEAFAVEDWPTAAEWTDRLS